MITKLQQFVGNERTLSSVADMLRENRVPQTLVIEGPAGSGKKTLAGLIAAGLLCESEAKPCGECEICALVQKQIHPDVTYVQVPKKKAAISVEQIRAVRSDAYILPGQGKNKVFIIDGVMNDAAQNAFLKVLEEPPKGVYFLILCTHRSQLIDTVISRGVILTLGAVSYEQALPLLVAGGLTDSYDLQMRFEQEGGLIGGMLSQSAGDFAVGEIADACAFAIANGKREDFLRAVAPAVDDRTMHFAVLSVLLEHIHDALASGLKGESAKDPAGLLARRLTPERLLALADFIGKEQQKINFNPNGWLFFTALCAGIFPRKG